MAAALVLLAGAILAIVAVVQASPPVLVVAAILMLAGVAAAAVLAVQRLDRPGPRAGAIAGVAAFAVVVLVPASMNVDRCDRIGRDADLSGCNLSDQDLSTEDLRGADLTDADLRGADLSRARLARADLRGADLRRANLSGAHLDRVVATGADLRGADFEGAALTNARLTDATVEGAVFTDAALARADLSGLDLANVDFTGATIDEADLSGASLRRAHLTSADLSGADLSEADLSGAGVDHATLDDVDLQGARLTGTNLRAATLGNADLRRADLSRADLREADAPTANFRDAVLTGAQLSNNDFVGSEGLADEDLAAAFGVPAARLAGVTAQRGVVLDRLEDITQAVGPVRNGRAVPEVRPYVPSNYFHPAIVFDTTDPGAAGWADTVRDQWAPTATRYAELVVIVLPEQRQSVETCQYVDSLTGAPAPAVTRYVVSSTVRVVAAHDARVVAERTFRGGDPRACGATESYLTTEIEGDPPDLSGEARPWLATLIHPPAQRA